MKPTILFFVLLLHSSSLTGQNQYLSVASNSDNDLKKIDSIGYIKIHTNTKLLFAEVLNLSEKLQKKGYFNNTISQQIRPNDSTFLFQIDLKNKIDFIDIYIGIKSALKSLNFDDLNVDIKRLKIEEIESFLEQLANRLENKGFSQAKVQLTNISQKEVYLTADLCVQLGTKRTINNIVIVGYDKFLKGIIKQINRKFRQKTFSIENLEKIKNTFNDYHFVSQTKYPEILFAKDTTKVYVYLQKIKANRFDGLIGFGNSENQKTRFNGYLDLMLVNTINAAEKFNLNWKSDGSKQSNFNVGIEIPYIFKSRLLLKSQLQIFKQDSLFQNTKLFADLGYFLKPNLKVFVGLETTESTNIQNTVNNISSFDKQFTTLQFDYSTFKERENAYFYLYPEQQKINFKIGVGKRKTFTNSENQNFAIFETLHNFNLSKKISVNIRSHSSIITSRTYFKNELFRFGGINSIRGFNENSLQANAFASALTEIRYALNQNLYLHTVTDYGFYEDKTVNATSTLFGIGAGFGLLTKNGLLQFIYANGRQKSQGNSIVHLNYKIGF